MSTYPLQISVVVIGRNEGQRLARCLESVAQVRGVSVRELIYVDSSSTDGSPQLAVEFGAAVIALNSERPTAALGRNAGWRLATSEIVLFLDGDTEVDPDFPLAACEALTRQPSTAAVWGNLREVHPEASIYNRVLDLDWIYAPGFTEFCGGNVLMRRTPLLELGGFDETLIAGEEPELCRRMRALGYAILHIDHSMARHDLQMTCWSQYWRRAIRSGHAYAEISDRFRGSDDPFWTADRWSNILRGGFWIVTLVLSMIAAVRFGLLPIALWIGLVFLVVVRTAWKARWKTDNRLTLLLYGFHSHLQQVPILVGQLQYELSKKRRQAREPLEYKERRVD